MQASKNILIAGGTGLVGQVLCKKLQDQGYNVALLSRSASSKSDRFYWNPEKVEVDPSAIAFADVIINLAGANVAQRWTEAYKQEITNSRTRSNEVLIAACRRQQKWPHVYLSAGGMNFYGDSQDKILSEELPPGKKGFLPESCVSWEKSVQAWGDFGVRYVQFRIAIVLSTKGGALPKMAMTLPLRILPMFGNGRQWYSWVHIEDLADMFIYALNNQNMLGIYNAGSPDPRRLNDFLKELARANDLQAIYPSVPVFALKLGLGDMSETVLSSVRLSVEKLLQTGFKYQFPELKAALKDLYRRKI